MYQPDLEQSGGGVGRIGGVCWRASFLDGGIFIINVYDITGHNRFLGEGERGRWAGGRGGFENFFSFSFSFGLVLVWERGEGGIYFDCLLT